MGTINALLNSVSASLAQQTAPVPVRAPAPSATTNANQETSSNAPSFTSPSQSVIQSASLLGASSDFAQFSSLLEVAQGSTQQVSDILQQLVALTQQVPQTQDLSGIESEFSQLLSQINQTVSQSNFAGKSLISGSSGDSAGDSDPSANALSLPDLSVTGLFGDNVPGVSSPEAAASALTQLTNAQETVTTASGSIGEVLTQLSFASASINTALANQDAANSTLTDSDVSDSSVSDGFSALFGSSASSAAQIQTANLPPSLLSLLQE